MWKPLTAFMKTMSLPSILYQRPKPVLNMSRCGDFLTTKDLYIIGMDKGLVLLIDRNGFTLGTAEDFETFIKEKCVNAEVRL